MGFREQWHNQLCLRFPVKHHYLHHQHIDTNVQMFLLTTMWRNRVYHIWCWSDNFTYHEKSPLANLLTDLCSETNWTLNFRHSSHQIPNFTHTTFKDLHHHRENKRWKWWQSSNAWRVDTRCILLLYYFLKFVLKHELVLKLGNRRQYMFPCCQICAFEWTQYTTAIAMRHVECVVA